jgi:hypothetical protein
MRTAMRAQAVSLHQPLRCRALLRIAALAFAWVPVWVDAQVMKLGVPSSLPSTLTSESINTSASNFVVPLANNPRDSLAWLRSKPDDPLYKTPPGTCKADSLVCYDYRKGQSVVPMTKSLMPEVPGLTREGVTLKRDKLSFHYSF